MASMLPTLIEQATLPVRATIKSIKLRTISKTIYLINRILQNILFFLYKPGHLISTVQIYKNLKMKMKIKRKRNKITLGSNFICQTSEGGASRVAMLALESTSNTRTKLSRDADAAMDPEGCAATETTPRQWPVLVRSRVSSSGFQSLTVSSSEPVIRRAGRVSVAGIHVAAHTDSSWAFSIDFRPASFIFLSVWRGAEMNPSREVTVSLQVLGWW